MDAAVTVAAALIVGERSSSKKPRLGEWMAT